MTDLLDRITWPVRTERLTLRRATTADAESTWRYRRLPEVREWISRGPATFDAYSEMVNAPDLLARTILIEYAGDVIGDVIVVVGDGAAHSDVAEQAAASEAEFGWTLHPEHGGRGLATEAVRTVFELCFGILELRRLSAGCLAANEPSWRLMERLGMRRERHSRKTFLHRSRGWVDSMSYAVLAEEWPAT